MILTEVSTLMVHKMALPLPPGVSLLNRTSYLFPRRPTLKCHTLLQLSLVMSVGPWVTNAVTDAMEEAGFVVLGATALVTARNTETDRVIESAARGVMDQEEEFVTHVMVMVVLCAGHARDKGS